MAGKMKSDSPTSVLYHNRPGAAVAGEPMSIEEAARRGYYFAGYDDYGYACFVSPEEEQRQMALAPPSTFVLQSTRGARW